MDKATGKITIARNAIALLAGEFGVRALSTIGAVLIARSLGPTEYGMLSVALAFSGIAAYAADIGLVDLTFRQLTAPNADVGLVLGTVFKARLVLASLSALASLLVILALYPEPAHRTVMLAVVLPTVCGLAMQGFAGSYFVAVQDMHITASLRMASQISTAVALVLSYQFHWPVQFVAVVYGGSALLGGFASLAMVRKRAPKIGGWSPKLLEGLSAFTVGGLTAVLLPQLGLMVLERVAAANDAGYFAVASRIPTVLYAIPACVATAWYPQMFLAGSADPERHFALSVAQIRINGLLGIGLSLPVALNSRLIIRLLLGDSWAGPSAPVLSLLAWMVMLNSISTPFADALTTKGMQTRRAIVYTCAVVVGGILFARFGATGGAVGTAYAALLTQVGLTAGLILANPCGLRLLRDGLRSLLIPGILGIAAAVAVRHLAPASYVSAAAGAAAYFVVAAAVDGDIRSHLARAVATVHGRWKEGFVNA